MQRLEYSCTVRLHDISPVWFDEFVLFHFSKLNFICVISNGEIATDSPYVYL